MKKFLKKLKHGIIYLFVAPAAIIHAAYQVWYFREFYLKSGPAVFIVQKYDCFKSSWEGFFIAISVRYSFIIGNCNSSVMRLQTDCCLFVSVVGIEVRTYKNTPSESQRGCWCLAAMPKRRYNQRR